MGINTVIQLSPGVVQIASASLIPNVTLAQLAATGTGNGANLIGYLPPGLNATARTVQSKLTDVVSVLDFGAQSDPTGTFDNTTAFTNAFAAGRKVLIPAGTWPCKSVPVPSNSLIEGEGTGQTTIIPVTGTNPGTMFSCINANHVEIRHLSFNVPKATANTTYVIYAQTSQNVHIHHVEMVAGGYCGIYTLNSNDVLVERCSVSNCVTRCIQHDGASSARTKTVYCYAANPGGSDHNIEVSGGSDHEIMHCYSTQATTFGITSQGCSRVRIMGNTVYNTNHEGIACGDSTDFIVDNNVVYWDTTTSQDFGMSFGGVSSGCSNGIVRGNKIINCGKSGIALAAAGFAITGFLVHGNHVTNSNRLNLGTASGGGGGVIVYGSLATGNLISDNKIVDTIGFLQYGMYEWNASTYGNPSANKYYANDASGFALAPTSINTTSYEALTSPDPVAYTPTISAGSGTLTTAAATGSYVLDGKKVFVEISGTITTNGTGATSIIFTLPFAASSAATANYVMSGREYQLTGKGMVGYVNASATTMVCSFYDGTYPGASGNGFHLSGWYMRS